MGEDIALHEHAARAATRVEHLAFGRFEHCNEHSYDTQGRKIFAAAFSFGVRELADKVFIHAPQHIDASGFGTKHVLGKEIDQSGDALFVEI